MSTEEITQLIQNCQSGDPEKQSVAIYALNELEAVEAIPILIDLLLSTPDKRVRADAAFILRFLGDQQPQPDALGPALLEALDDDDEKVRNNAAESLGYLHFFPAHGRLRSLLQNDSTWFVRASAAEALGRLADEGSIPDLQQAISDLDPRVQRYVVIALGQFLKEATVASLIESQLSNKVQDLTVKAELLALSYRLGHRSHLRDLLAILDHADDYDLASNLLEVLIDLTEKKPSVDIPPEDKIAIQITLQKTQLTHPSLLSDIERVRRNLE